MALKAPTVQEAQAWIDQNQDRQDLSPAEQQQLANYVNYVSFYGRQERPLNQLPDASKVRPIPRPAGVAPLSPAQLNANKAARQAAAQAKKSEQSREAKENAGMNLADRAAEISLEQAMGIQKGADTVIGTERGPYGGPAAPVTPQEITAIEKEDQARDTPKAAADQSFASSSQAKGQVRQAHEAEQDEAADRKITDQELEGLKRDITAVAAHTHLMSGVQQKALFHALGRVRSREPGFTPHFSQSRGGGQTAKQVIPKPAMPGVVKVMPETENLKRILDWSRFDQAEIAARQKQGAAARFNMRPQPYSDREHQKGGDQQQ